jgi:hypothetical protein
MRIAARFAAIATLGVSALVTGAALVGLGSDRWISSGYAPRPADTRAKVWGAEVWSTEVSSTEVWGNGLKSVVATEAEWLAARTTRLNTAAVPATARIDLGPLDIIDVRPLPVGLDLGASQGGVGQGEVGDAKLLVSAREPASGRTVRFIVDAGGVVTAPRTSKHDGL